MTERKQTGRRLRCWLTFRVQAPATGHNRRVNSPARAVFDLRFPCVALPPPSHVRPSSPSVRVSETLHALRMVENTKLLSTEEKIKPLGSSAGMDCLTGYTQISPGIHYRAHMTVGKSCLRRYKVRGHRLSLRKWHPLGS